MSGRTGREGEGEEGGVLSVLVFPSIPFSFPSFHPPPHPIPSKPPTIPEISNRVTIAHGKTSYVPALTRSAVPFPTFPSPFSHHLPLIPSFPLLSTHHPLFSSLLSLSSLPSPISFSPSPPPHPSPFIPSPPLPSPPLILPSFPLPLSPHPRTPLEFTNRPIHAGRRATASNDSRDNGRRRMPAVTDD